MKFFVPGFLAGACISIFLFVPKTGMEFYPNFSAPVAELERLEVNRVFAPKLSREFNFKTDKTLFRIDGSGKAERIDLPGEYTALSGNGKYYVRFDKVGKEIEFFTTAGDRFWKMHSREYPYLSFEGQLILLLNGDHSRIRIVDHNGNEIGDKVLAGRMCTAIAFAEKGNTGAVGFLDGSYYSVNAKGEIVVSGRVQGAVKGIAAAVGGRKVAVHFGNSQKDSLHIIDLDEETEATAVLQSVHSVKTSLVYSAAGEVLMLDGSDFVRFEEDGGEVFRYAVGKRREGHSAICSVADMYALSYTTAAGPSEFMLFSNDGVCIIEKTFNAESFLDVSVRGLTVLLRGSDNLYSYNIHLPEK
jgi:hypothetical protein